VLPDIVKQRLDESGKRVDPRIGRSKQLLAEALQRLTRERCFEDITVQDILESATINRATFYSHFEDKHALLHYLLTDFFKQTLRKRVAVGAPPGREVFTEMIQAICSFLTEVRNCPSLGSPANDPTAENAMRPFVRDTLLPWAKASAPTDRLFDAELNADVAAAAICTASMRWTRSGPAWSPEEFSRKLYPMVAYCLGVQAGERFSLAVAT
jgi:AcrR family transcriptional regulator